MNTMGSMDIRQKIAWLSVERLRPLSGMEIWFASLPRSRLGKQTNKGLCNWKEIEKASELWNRDVETRLREGASTEIEKKSRGMLERSIGLFRIRK